MPVDSCQVNYKCWLMLTDADRLWGRSPSSFSDEFSVEFWWFFFGSKKWACDLVMKVSPKLVTIFFNDFVHILSPTICEFYFELRKLANIDSPKFVKICMICRSFRKIIHQNLWRTIHQEISPELVKTFLQTLVKIKMTCKIFLKKSPKLVKNYSPRNFTKIGDKSFRESREVVRNTFFYAQFDRKGGEGVTNPKLNVNICKKKKTAQFPLGIWFLDIQKHFFKFF